MTWPKPIVKGELYPLSYSHTRAQLKVFEDLGFLRTNSLWTKNEARQYLAIGCYSLDPSSVECKKD